MSSGKITRLQYILTRANFSSGWVVSAVGDARQDLFKCRLHPSRFGLQGFQGKQSHALATASVDAAVVDSLAVLGFVANVQSLHILAAGDLRSAAALDARVAEVLAQAADLGLHEFFQGHPRGQLLLGNHGAGRHGFPAHFLDAVFLHDFPARGHFGEYPVTYHGGGTAAGTGVIRRRDVGTSRRRRGWRWWRHSLRCGGSRGGERRLELRSPAARGLQGPHHHGCTGACRSRCRCGSWIGYTAEAHREKTVSGADLVTGLYHPSGHAVAVQESSVAAFLVDEQTGIAFTLDTEMEAGKEFVVGNGDRGFGGPAKSDDLAILQGKLPPLERPGNAFQNDVHSQDTPKPLA